MVEVSEGIKGNMEERTYIDDSRTLEALNNMCYDIDPVFQIEDYQPGQSNITYSSIYNINDMRQNEEWFNAKKGAFLKGYPELPDELFSKALNTDFENVLRNGYPTEEQYQQSLLFEFGLDTTDIQEPASIAKNSDSSGGVQFY